MSFTGNDQCAPADGNRIFDEVGAKYNAATAEELTMFYAAVLPEYRDRTTELLAALIRPALRLGLPNSLVRSIKGAGPVFPAEGGAAGAPATRVEVAMTAMAAAANGWRMM